MDPGGKRFSHVVSGSESFKTGIHQTGPRHWFRHLPRTPLRVDGEEQPDCMFETTSEPKELMRCVDVSSLEDYAMPPDLHALLSISPTFSSRNYIGMWLECSRASPCRSPVLTTHVNIFKTRCTLSSGVPVKTPFLLCNPLKKPHPWMLAHADTVFAG